MSSGNRNLLTLILLRLFRPFGDAAWVAIASVICALLVLIGSIYLWDAYGEQILGQSRYRLHAENLVITEQPAWIRSNIKEYALENGRLEGELLSDRTLTPRIARAFLSVPWVDDVKMVNKTRAAQGQITVELSYRKPVAMVELPPGSMPNFPNKSCLLAVDAAGRLLPTEENFSEAEANQYPKIGGIDVAPVGLMYGQPWNDPRVADAAQIVDMLGDLWQKLSLYRIDVPKQADSSPLGPDQHQDFVLVTSDGTARPWGSAPGKELPQERTATEKVKLLREAVDDSSGANDTVSQISAPDWRMVELPERPVRR